MGARENEKTKVHRWEVEGKARRKKETGRTEEGYAVERWWISGRVEDGWVAASKGCQDGGTGAEGGQEVGRRKGGRGEGLRGWKTHPFSCLPSLAV